MLRVPRRLFALAFASATAVTISACGARSELVFDGDEAAADRAGSASATSACAALADAYCDKLELCDPLRAGYDAGRSSFSFRDGAQCRERFALACTELAPLPGATAIDAQARACASKLTTSVCEALPALPSFDWPTLCGFSGGTLRDGFSCMRDLQCSSGRCGGSDGLCGFCAETRADGQACGGPEGAFCRVGSACRKGICQRLPTGGERCGAQATCADGFVCADGVVCTSPYATGPRCGVASCGPAGAPICDDKGGCVPTAVADTEGSCGDVAGPSTEAPVLCPREHACVSQNDFGSGRCRPLAREGEPCDRFAGPACLFPATCGATACQLAGPCSR